MGGGLIRSWWGELTQHRSHWFAVWICLSTSNQSCASALFGKLESSNWPWWACTCRCGGGACVSCSAGGTEEGKECLWLVYSWTTECCLGQNTWQNQCHKPHVCEADVLLIHCVTSGHETHLKLCHISAAWAWVPEEVREALCNWTSDTDLLHLNYSTVLPFSCLFGSEKMTGVQTSRLCCWRLMENHYLHRAPRQSCQLLPTTTHHPPHYRPVGLGLGAITFGEILSRVQRH